MANFFLYRVKATYQANQPPVNGTYSPSTRYIPQFSNSAGTTWQDMFPGDQPQSLISAQQAINEVISAENSFREQVILGRLGTLTDYIAYP